MKHNGNLHLYKNFFVRVAWLRCGDSVKTSVVGLNKDVACVAVTNVDKLLIHLSGSLHIYFTLVAWSYAIVIFVQLFVKDECIQNSKYMRMLSF